MRTAFCCYRMSRNVKEIHKNRYIHVLMFSCKYPPFHIRLSEVCFRIFTNIEYDLMSCFEQEIHFTMLFKKQVYYAILSNGVYTHAQVYTHTNVYLMENFYIIDIIQCVRKQAAFKNSFE
jgi:hypothetical protein